MKTDKNTVIGFVLLGILFFAYFWYSTKQQNELQAIKQKQEDSIRRVQEAKGYSYGAPRFFKKRFCDTFLSSR